MSEFQAFFADNAVMAEIEEFAVSERFIQRDEKGKPILDKEGKTFPLKWKIKGISEEENTKIRDSATRKVKGKNGVMIPETNGNEYLAKLAVACVVFPDLHNAELQKSYGVMGADNLIRKMLLAGEFGNLIAKVQEINGYDKDINEVADAVKN